MKNETASESTDTSTVESAPYPPEAQMFYAGASERFYAFLVDSEESVYVDDWVGAVDIGELSRSQYIIFKKKFSQAYTGKGIGFHCQQPLSSNTERSLKIALNNYRFLTGDQKQALDVAIRVADQVRDAENCEDKNGTMDASAVMEPTDCFYQAQAASGRGNPKSAVDAYNESIEWAGDPAEVIVKNKEPIFVRDMGAAGDMLWVTQMSKHPDEKFRHWAMWKSGIGCTDIAKSENPTLAQKVGQEEAQKQWASEGEKIRMQVRSVENMLEKRKPS